MKSAKTVEKVTKTGKAGEKQSLISRLLGATTLDYTGVLDTSEIYNTKDITTTLIPSLNIAYSGMITGGFTSGLTVWAGPSKHFKTLFCLISAAAYLKKYPEAVMLFFDSEFGSPKQYFRSAGIDPARVIHIPIVSLEELRTELTNQLLQISRGDKVIIVVDSMGNLASNKEIKDAEDGSEKADMTRAKVGKSLFRIVTPHLRLKDIPMFVVAHTYDTMEMYSKKVVSGGNGIYYSADSLFIVGRQQEKDTSKDLTGYNFTINVEKSRYVKEKSKIEVTVLFNGGVLRWSGLFDLAVEGKLIHRLNAQKYCRVLDAGVVDDTNPFTRGEVENDSAFWKTLFETTSFLNFIEQTFAVSTGDLITDDSHVEQLDDLEEVEETEETEEPALEVTEDPVE